MHRGAQHLVGTHDFVSFQSAGSERESTIRTLFAAEVASRAPDPGLAPGARTDANSSESDETPALVTIEVEGDGFLYNMVRSIAGTLAEVGRGKRDAAWIADALAAKDRTQAGQTAPPHGLSLLRVEY
jgi:tRNA pseudouridine38-40 synthase